MAEPQRTAEGKALVAPRPSPPGVEQDPPDARHVRTHHRGAHGLDGTAAGEPAAAARARTQHERAIQLNPNDATAHHWFAADVLASAGDHARELAEMKRALELDPLSLVINTNLGHAYLHNGRLDDAIAQFQKTIEMDPHFYFAQSSYGVALEVQGKLPEATVQYEKAAAMSDDPVALGMLGHAYGIAGRKDEARQIFDKLLQLRDQKYTAAYSLAIAALGLRDRNEVLNWLEKGYRERDGNNLNQIRIDPLLASLRGDPRFEALAENIVPAREFGASSK